MKEKNVPISISLEVKQELTRIQGRLMQEKKKRVSINKTLEFLIENYGKRNEQ
jgi:hypothetical protein